MTPRILFLRLLRPVCLGVAAGILVPAFQTVGAQTDSSSASPPIHAQQKGAGGKGTNSQNRARPKHRTGAEGHAEAKIDADQARELYIRRKQRLEQIHAQQKELAKDQHTLAANRARMRARLIETAHTLRLSEKRLTEIEEKLGQTRAKAKEEREKLEDKSAQMSALLVLMQGMSRQPPPVMITHSKDALKMIRTGMVLAAFYSDVEKLAAQLAEEVNRLDRTQRTVELQEQRRKSEQAQSIRLKAQIDLLMMENRQQLEMASVNLEHLQNVSQINLANLKTLEDMLPVLDAAAKKGKPASHEERGGEAAPGRLAAAQLGRMAPAVSFVNSQGLLPLPAQGRMLIKFGQSGRDGAASKGVQIETRPGAQVVSPCDGAILYAGPFRAYGQLLIIDPGGGYHIVIAGMDRIQVTQHQAVLAGEPIATMGADPRSSEKTAARPILYVEFRRDQQSIDPAPWWSAGGKG